MNNRSTFRSQTLRPDQKIAAHTLERHLSVTAGPGAGKTFVLVERYLEILRQRKVSVDNIVAITFTNRAANEMRERVRAEIDKLLKRADGDERRRWLRHKRALEGASITTIHGFCSRLLHEFPLEADIDPQFTLLDEHRATMLLETMVEESLTNAIQHGDERIVQMTLGATRAALATALMQLYWKYRGEGMSLDEVEKLSLNHHATEANYFSALKELDATIALWMSAPKLSRDAEKKRWLAANEWPSLRARLAKPANEHTIAAYCQAIEDFREWRPKKGSAPGVEALDDLLWGSNSTDKVSGRVPALCFDLLARDYTLSLIRVLRDIERRLEAEKQKLSALDFDDLQLRTLKLLKTHPEARARIAERYRFFLIDEFQDTNGLQRDLMTRLALDTGANLFIVGDRKQSIYGFRGADVDVFTEMTSAIVAGGGVQQPLRVNFRSQKSLIDVFNLLFKRIFAARSDIPREELSQLGYVEHESSIAERVDEHELPLVEFLMSVLPWANKSSDDESRGRIDLREWDAAQVVERIDSLTRYAGVSPANAPSGRDARVPRYGDIAILFRAMTGVWAYENALRRAGIPYLTVQGKGFYQREEIADLIQLLKFLDNITDELALAAVLRSPLCGISDNALLALRCAPQIGEALEPDRLQRRNLLRAVQRQYEIQFIDEDERMELDRAAAFLDSMIQRRNRYGIADLLRYAVSATDYLTVIAANFDGAQRIANVEKLFLLAERFESTGANLIRDFVRYVEEFEAIGGREGEGQMDRSANVVHLMTIHQAKGQEFPIVIIPDLHRKPMDSDASFILDPRKGLSVKIPDGRGQMVRGAFLNELQKRAAWREEFEAMRVLYVAATRAKDRLILSGAAAQSALKNLTETESGQWLAWIWQALELDEHPQSGTLTFDDGAQIRLQVNREWARRPMPAIISSVDERDADETSALPVIDGSRPLAELFPLLEPVRSGSATSLRRFSVTQLINFQRCARQYFFDRMLHAPGREELAVWNDAEAPEPPANLTAALKGAVIHRFCETFREGDQAEARLRTSYQDVKAQRQAEMAGRALDIDDVEAVRALLPLAENYLASDVFKRVAAAQQMLSESATRKAGSPAGQPGWGAGTQSSPEVWSELRFRLRRPVGILSGTIDKLLITPSASGSGVDVEIIDFKTNRFTAPAKRKTKSQNAVATVRAATAKSSFSSNSAQGTFDFDSVVEEVVAEEIESFDLEVPEPPDSIERQIAITAHDYQLQMQSYALALRELLGVRIPTSRDSDGIIKSSLQQPLNIASIRATLHFIDPKVEISLPSSLLDEATCAAAIDQAMSEIASLDGTLDADQFPPTPATHCRMCNFRDLCPAGRDFLRRSAAT